ncbi:hypothetical protein ACIGW4_07035 [Streptomyces sp. NPDC053513]|uniref:Uncharacterized protein n=1 Tax=Streptomyces litmocidini TaxID=67318 RepID=A0ABW7UA95_9ACTN
MIMPTFAQGVITPEAFSMLVLVAVLTAAAAVPLHRRAIPDSVEKEMPVVPPAPHRPTSWPRSTPSAEPATAAARAVSRSHRMPTPGYADQSTFVGAADGRI